MALTRFSYSGNQQERTPARIYPRYSPSYSSSPTKVFLEEVDESPGYGGFMPRTPEYPTYFPGFYRSKVDFKPYDAFGYIDTFRPEPTTYPMYSPHPVQTQIGTNITPVLSAKFTRDAFKWIGYLLCFLAILSFGFEIANLAIAPSTSSYYDDYRCTPAYGFMVVPWFFTWVAPGIWASIPIFISGILAIIVADNYGRVFQALAIFSSLSAFFFAPAIIAISGAELGTFVNACMITVDQINKFSSPLSLKFVFPIIVIVLGILELIFLLILTIMLCRAYVSQNSKPVLIENNQMETDMVQIPGPPMQQMVIPPPPPTFPAEMLIPSLPRALPPTLPPPRPGDARLIVLEEHNKGRIVTNYPSTQTAGIGSGGYYWK